MMDAENGFPRRQGVKDRTKSGIMDDMGALLTIDPELRALLVCPVDHAELRDEADALACTRCGRRYPVEDGIPNMVPDEEMPGTAREA